MTDVRWLDDALTPIRPDSECCAKCRRGTKAHGVRPCGYPGTCPNPNCEHSRAPR